MEKYIALLRGINVSGKNLIKMETLREQLNSLGLSDVQTYIQSGNIILKNKKVSNSELENKIGKLINDFFGLQIAVIVKSQTEFNKIIEENPFNEIVPADFNKLVIVFLKETPLAEQVEKLNSNHIESEEFHIKSGVVYLFCKQGYGKAKITTNYIESNLKVKATARNWNTILKLKELQTKY